MLTKARKHLRLWSGLSVLIIMTLIAQPISMVLAANDTVTINMALYGGAPTYMASGFIYGIAQDASQPSVSLMTDIKVRHMRHGGSQIGCPNGGWVNGQYAPRRDSIIAYYNRAATVGAKYQLILAGAWGSDGVCNVPSWPGDNGNWTAYDSFLNQVIDDVLANGMSSSTLRWDIWNEPNIGFWGRTQTQYLEMWKRGYQLIRSRIPTAVIVGPSTAGAPGGTWWTTYLDYVKANNVVPNIMSWHDLPGDPVASANTLNGLLSARGITTVQGYSVNEYGGGSFGESGPSDQQPGPSAWYIARLERGNIEGVRANWAMGGGLYAGMGDLVNSSWQPTGAYWIYKRYADQTGLRTSVTAGSQVDAIAFQDSTINKSIIVVGNRGGVTGTVNVVINNIPAWLQNAGQTHVLLEKMSAGTAYVPNPTVLSNSAWTVTGNSLTIPINWTNALDGYVLTLSPTSTGVPTSTPLPTPTPIPAGSQLEAENATRAGGTCVATNHTGYTGTGFVACYDTTTPGRSTNFTFNLASAGAYPVTLRYSAGPDGPASNRTLSIYVNGTKIRQTSLVRTSAWNVWATKAETLNLSAGLNTIKYQFDSGDTGWANLDNIVIGSAGPTPTRTPTPIPLTPTRTPTPGGSTQYEAENAARAGGTCTASNHTGYTGSGFVACYDATPNGRSTTFTVNVASAGSKTVTLRYSAGPNGPATNRTVSIYVNGTKIRQTSLVRTSAWNVWATKAETLTLNAGSNTIKYQLDTGDTGWINIDNIIVQ